jgi:DNA-binding transcriptional MocR family regulator
MSYKLDMSDLDRDSGVSLTQQLVDHFVAGIESGVLAPGEKLPPTRTLAAEAGINHLTAARVYRRLAEEGWVTASVGRGTFVRTLVPAAADERGDDWQAYVLPDRPTTYQEEILDDSFRMAGQPDMISMSTGFPSPRFHPSEELAEIAQLVFEEEGVDAIAYTQPEGLLALREQVATHVDGEPLDPDQVIVTTGAQQALDIVYRSLLEPGDVAVTESPTFTGSLLAMRSTGARVIGVPVDAHGLDVDALEVVLARHEVRLLALQATCHNPTGVDLSPERRARLMELAVDRNMFVLEDRVYSDLRYEGDPPPPLRESAPGHVIEVNSLSKVVGGGLRVGWINARGPVLRRLATIKQATDFHSPTPVQHMAARYLAGNGYERQLELSLPYYRERRDALMAALERHLAGEYEAATPGGGHHVWVTLTRPVEERVLYAEAVRHGMSFTPGGAVTAERRQRTSLRLSFSLLEPAELEEGVRRLARALREVRRRERTSVAAPLS